MCIISAPSSMEAWIIRKVISAAEQNTGIHHGRME